MRISVWTPERIERLITMWTVDHLSASQCATVLGDGITKNSVIGKTHRMGLPLRAARRWPPKLLAEKKERARPQRGNPFIAKPPLDAFERVDVTTIVVADQDIPLAQRRRLLDLGPNNCRWPVGDPGTLGFFFCGGASNGETYCIRHARIANPHRHRTRLQEVSLGQMIRQSTEVTA